MAATTAAVVAEEDTELRDLLVQTLENSGVLNRIKVRREGGRASAWRGRGRLADRAARLPRSGRLLARGGWRGARRPWGLVPRPWAGGVERRAARDLPAPGGGRPRAWPCHLDGKLT